MKKNSMKVIALGLIGLMTFGAFLNVNLERKYKLGQYIPDEDAYYSGEITSAAGHIKAHEFVTPSDNKYSTQKDYSHGTNMLGDLENTWELYTGSGTTIAVIDDGFDYNHPEYVRANGTSAILNTSRYYYMSGNSVYNKKYSDDPSCIDEDWEYDDYEGKYVWATHGTATSTTAAAPMGNNGGVGIAPEANILALKIDMSFGAIEKAIRYAVDEGADVINMSLGAFADFNFEDGFGDTQNPAEYDGETYTAEDYADIATYLESACQYAYNHNVIVIAAAGNEATYHKSYPACNYKVVGVGALEKNDEATLARFTNYIQASQTGEVNVDILAPGFVYTAEKAGSQSSPTHTYNSTQGTSFSSPIVAGAACLWKQKNPSGTPDQFLSALQSTASDAGTYYSKYVPTNKYGTGYTKQGPSQISQGRLNVGNLLDINDPYVNLKQSSIDVVVGSTKQVQLDSYNGEISYSIQNTNIATVSNSGLVEGKAAGSTTLTVTASKNSTTASKTIPVNVGESIACQSLTISPTEVTIAAGETYEIEPTITTVPSNASRVFMFASNDETVATVDFEEGIVTGVAAGDTTIEIEALDGNGSAVLTVNVTAPATPTSWEKVTSSSDLTNGDYLIVYGTGNCAFNGGLTTLDATNNVISVTISNDKITYDSTTAAAKFTINTVTGGYSIQSASGYYIGRGANSNGIDSSTSEAYVNTISISSGNATVNGSGGKTLCYNTKSGQNRFRYMSSGGVIQLYKAGSGSAPTPTPTPTVSSVSVSPSTLSLDLNGTKTSNLTATVNGTNSPAQTVTWSSSDSNKVQVSSSGQVTAKAVTTSAVTITATSTVDSTKSGTCSVTVTDSSSGGDSGDDYVLVTSNSDLSTGDYVVVTTSQTGSNIKGVTGWNGTKDATVSATESEWVQYEVQNASSSGWKLYDANADKHIASPGSSNQFLYGTGATCSVNDSGQLKCNNRILCQNGTNYRFYSSVGSYIPFYVYLVNSSSSSKVIGSLSASYSGSSLYVGDSLDESKVTVTASFTDSSYSDITLTSSSYSLSGFSSSTAGQKTVTVTYTGSMATSTTPMTTTFNVNVLANPVTNVAVTNTRTYHPGETISKSDITVTLTYASGSSSTTTDFTFANNGYQFTYADAPSGGSNGSKQFSITYAGSSYNFTVSVNRNAYQAVSGSTKTLSSSEFSASDLSKNSGTASSTSVTIGGVGFTVTTNAYVFTQSYTNYLSFGSTAGSINNTSAFASDLTSITVTQKSGARQDGVLTISKDNVTYVAYSAAEIAKGGYRYFKYEYVGTSSASGAAKYSNIQSIEYTLAGQDNPTNVANYIMYEDTNNQCTTKLDLAIDKLNTMSSSDKTTFWTSNDYVIATARERLQAWARHEGKELDYSNGTYQVSGARNIPAIIGFDASDNGTMIFLITLTSVSLITIGGFIFLKKRKEY